MTKLPIKFGFSELSTSFETYSSHATEASAEAKRERYVADVAAKRHGWLYNGWWVIVDTSTRPWKLLSATGVGSKKNVPFPEWRRDAT